MIFALFLAVVANVAVSLRLTTSPVIIGLSGGFAENLSCRLLEQGISATTILDRSPYSPSLLNNEKADIFIGDISSEDSLKSRTGRGATFQSLVAGKSIILCGDEGDERVRGPIDRNTRSESSKLIESVIKKLNPSSTQGLTLASAASDGQTGGLGRLFGLQGAELVRDWSSKNSIPLSILSYGKLCGGVPGLEPLPFVGLPLLEPELDPSYVLRSVVLADAKSNKYASTEICSRASITEALSRLIQRQDVGVEALIVSIAGSEPSDKQWNQLFSRVINVGNAELLRIDFASIIKPDFFLNWLADTWFPQALVEADAATVLTGARPVRATKSVDAMTVSIRWDDITPDLTIKTVGSLEIKLDLAESALVVTRKAGSSLPRESQLIDKLLESVNKNAYRKGFCTALDSVSS